MVENSSEPVAETVSAPTSEPTETPPTSLAEEKPLMTAEEPLTEVEAEDEEKVEKLENEFAELDEDLSDVEESADTIWLLRRVGLGILKVLLVLGGLGFIGWLIWGGNASQEIEKVRQELPGKIQSVKEKIPQAKDVFKQPQKQQETVSNTAPIETQSLAGRSLLLWNYWMESQRVSAQTGLLSDSLLWKREVETVFEIPFPEQINGLTPLVRDSQVGRLLQVIKDLLNRSDVLQARLSDDIVEFSNKAALARNASLAAEQEFINSLKQSNPVGITEILDQKIEAEKEFQKFSVDAEARRIFTQKISEYQLVLENIQTVLTMNREAIAQDIQVVNFPADPFGRVISPGQWSAPQ